MIFNHYGRCFVNMVRAPNEKPNVEQGKFVHYDPLRAMEENARPPRLQTLSYADYYARYHTTAPRDGWQMANPTGQKVIYVKN